MKKKILFLEPFYGGSHRNFADNIVSHSKHDIDLFTLPARFWKWRMRGAALYFSQHVANPEKYDLLFLSDLMSLSDLKALWNRKCPPAIVYFHENQLSYPLPPGEKMDYQFGFTDKIIFNSRFHMNSFFSSLPGFIRKMPEFKPNWAVNVIKQKSEVIYPGCDFSIPDTINLKTDKTPLIIWNHRWEFDKNPESFFKALNTVDDNGCKFNIALLGENFQAVPKQFISAKERYGSRILNYGFVKTRKEYINWLLRGDIVISTSNQENFGISVIESIRYGCRPLLPERLTYPEIIPPKYHKDLIYKDDKDLSDKLLDLLSKKSGLSTLGLKESMIRYSWKNMIHKYDKLFDEMN